MPSLTGFWSTAPVAPSASRAWIQGAAAEGNEARPRGVRGKPAGLVNRTI